MIKSAAASEKFATQAIGLVRDFAAFAGRNGVRGAILAIAAAMSEGVGLVLLVPLLSIATAANGGAGRLYDAVLRVLDLAGAQTRAARLSLLLRHFCRAPGATGLDRRPPRDRAGAPADGLCRASAFPHRPAAGSRVLADCVAAAARPRDQSSGRRRPTRRRRGKFSHAISHLAGAHGFSDGDRFFARACADRHRSRPDCRRRVGEPADGWTRAAGTPPGTNISLEDHSPPSRPPHPDHDSTTSQAVESLDLSAIGSNWSVPEIRTLLRDGLGLRGVAVADPLPSTFDGAAQLVKSLAAADHQEK